MCNKSAIGLIIRFAFFRFVQDRATPIFIASQNGHRAVLLTLLAEGGDPNICRIDGASPLWIAAQMGHDHIVRVLLKSGARVDAVRCDGATPLFKAAHKGFSAVVHELLKYKPNLYLLPVITDSHKSMSNHFINKCLLLIRFEFAEWRNTIARCRNVRSPGRCEAISCGWKRHCMEK